MLKKNQLLSPLCCVCVCGGAGLDYIDKVWQMPESLKERCCHHAIFDTFLFQLSGQIIRHCSSFTGTLIKTHLRWLLVTCHDLKSDGNTYQAALCFLLRAKQSLPKRTSERDGLSVFPKPAGGSQSLPCAWNIALHSSPWRQKRDFVVSNLPKNYIWC